jgi:hypothetical protein
MSYLGTRPDIGRIRFDGHVWRSRAGTVFATVDLGDATIWFDSADDARALAAACTAAAEAYDQFAAREESADGQ